jgi:hypothetical protein
MFSFCFQENFNYVIKENKNIFQLKHIKSIKSEKLKGEYRIRKPREN